jgi:hypothetical protein
MPQSSWVLLKGGVQGGAYARFSDFSGIEKVPSVPAHESNTPAVFTGSPQKAQVYKKPSRQSME